MPNRFVFCLLLEPNDHMPRPYDLNAVLSSCSSKTTAMVRYSLVLTLTSDSAAAAKSL